jgi:hypothetical protein
MAVPAATAEKFPQSIARGSRSLVRHIGYATGRDDARRSETQPIIEEERCLRYLAVAAMDEQTRAYWVGVRRALREVA